MLSCVLTSARAVQVNAAIMRTFVRLRQLLATHEELARRLEQLEWRQHEQAGRRPHPCLLIAQRDNARKSLGRQRQVWQ